MKKKIGIFISLILFLMSSLTMLTGCNEKKNRIEEGDFYYTVALEGGNTVMPHRFVIRLKGLTEIGKQKKTLILPDKLGGHSFEIYSDDNSTFFYYQGGVLQEIVSDNLEKLYWPKPLIAFGNALNQCPNLKTVILNTWNDDWKHHYISMNLGAEYYVPSYVIEGDIETNAYQGKIGKFSNVTFLYNYEGAKNHGYFWTDNYEYGSLIQEPPQNPYQERYQFKGWYKDVECTMKWNFSLDKLPEAKYNEKGEEIYQETKLYAKWANW